MPDVDYYDSLCLTKRHEMEPRSLRLFGNANIGCIERCNLQVPGQLCGGGDHRMSFEIRMLKARAELADALGASETLQRVWARYRACTTVTVSVGDRDQVALPLWMLLAGGWPPARPIHVPWRQNISVRLEYAGDEGAALFGILSTLVHEEQHLWIHLSGARVP